MAVRFRFACTLIAAALWALPALSADAWPTVALPRDAEPFDVGQQMTVDGMPMRIDGFVSKAPLAETLSWFRRSLGQPLVENVLNGKRILGRAQGEHYLTVQLEAVDAGRGGGTRGLVAVTHLKAAIESREHNEAAARQWLARLPSGSQLHNQIGARDGAKTSRYLVFSNRHDEALNIERLKSLMHDDGYTIERETGASREAALRLPQHVANGRTLYFRAPSKEAMAVVARNGQGRTTIVLNTVTLVEGFK